MVLHFPKSIINLHLPSGKTQLNILCGSGLMEKSRQHQRGHCTSKSTQTHKGNKQGSLEMEPLALYSFSCTCVYTCLFSSRIIALLCEYLFVSCSFYRAFPSKHIAFIFLLYLNFLLADLAQRSSYKGYVRKISLLLVKPYFYVN